MNGKKDEQMGESVGEGGVSEARKERKWKWKKE